MVYGEITANLYFTRLLGEDGGLRRDHFMVKQPGLFAPKFDATSSHAFTQSRITSQYYLEFTVWPVGTSASRYHTAV
jgi:hypothetical protein